jgi:hypothetical protein
MVDELDPELDAANQRQDAKDAARFRADAATLSEEAAHDRTKAEELRRMGLAAESDQMAKDAAALAGRSADFTHRAELLDEALVHRKQGDADLAGVPEAHAQAEAAKTKGDQLSDQALLSFGEDVPATIRLTAEAGAERGKEAALRELETQLGTNAETEIVFTAVEEERQAREGLVYRAAPQPGIVDPWATAPTSSIAPTGADEPVALAPDPVAEAEPTDA